MKRWRIGKEEPLEYIEKIYFKNPVLDVFGKPATMRYGVDLERSELLFQYAPDNSDNAMWGEATSYQAGQVILSLVNERDNLKKELEDLREEMNDRAIEWAEARDRD